MSQAVLADAQFSVARVFRPFLGFESIYEGVTSRRPILIPGTLDPDAGRPGYATNLVSGISVPFGSKVMLWVPTIYLNSGDAENPDLLVVPYRYQFIWRLRNIRDYQIRRGRSAYHFPRQSPGAGGNVVVPSAQNIVVFEGPQQTFDSLATAPGSQFSSEVFATHQTVLERIEFESTTPLAPFIPGAATPAAYQQGVATFTGVTVDQQVTFNCLQLDAQGDELLIAVDRLGGMGEVTSATAWDFANPNGVDFGLSLFFGAGSGSIIRDLGVYVFTGSNP